MMTTLSPPVGFGKKCPKIVAYKVKMTGKSDMIRQKPCKKPLSSRSVQQTQIKKT